MANAQEEQNQKREIQNRNAKIREALSKGYAAVVGQRTVSSFSAITMEELFDARIEEIEGAGTQLRPNLLDRIDRIEKETKDAVEQMREIPPEEFVEKDSEDDVNTDVEPEDEE